MKASKLLLFISFSISLCAVAQENNEILGEDIIANSNRAKKHYQDYEDDKASELLDKNLALQDSLGIVDFETYTKDLLLKARILGLQDNYAKALQDSQTAYKIADSMGLQMSKAVALEIIGSLNLKMNNLKPALEYNLEALTLFKQLNEKREMVRTLSSVGSTYVLLDQRPLAKAYFEEMLSVTIQENFEDDQATAYDRLGGLAVEAGNFEQGIPYLIKGVNIWRKGNNEFALSVALLNLGNAYYDRKDYRKAIETLDECIAITDAKFILSIAHKYRSASYEALSQPSQALADFKRHKSMNDSVWNIEKSQQIEELRAQFDTEKKVQQIALQEKEIKVLEQKAEISALQKILLGSLLVLSLIGFYGIRQKLKRNKLEKERVDAELAFKKKELTTHALHLAKKNEVLESLKQKAQDLKDREAPKNGYQQLIHTINFDLQDDNNWENFARYFEEVHKDFNSNVKAKYPDVTSNELRLLALLKMNLSSKEIANILNISPEGIKKARYRLRKKLDITTEDSLQDLVLSL